MIAPSGPPSPLKRSSQVTEAAEVTVGGEMFGAHRDNTAVAVNG